MAGDVFDLIVERDAANLDLLHEELRAVLGEVVIGVSAGVGPGRLRIHLRADRADEVAGQARAVLARHDATKQSAAQRREAERARFAARLRGRAWGAWSASDKDEALRLVVEALLGGA